MKRQLFFLALVPVWASAQTISLPAGVVKPAFFDKQGIKVLSYKKGVGGLNAWLIERGATKTVMYTTPDNKVLLSGVLWDSASGANLSDAYMPVDLTVAPADKNSMAALPADQQTAPQATPTSTISSVTSKLFSSAKMSDAIKGVSSLEGIKEGKAAADKTLYIMFDPRCPYCHSVYLKTRSYVKNGGTIKWVPTTILGDRFNGARMIADTLQASNRAAALGKVMGAKTGSATPSKETMDAISKNESYFFAAFEANKAAGQPGVPVAFFETKDGAPQMVTGIDDDALLSRILTDIKK